MRCAKYLSKLINGNLTKKKTSNNLKFYLKKKNRSNVILVSSRERFLGWLELEDLVHTMFLG